jgi:hypothetical protein
MSLRCNLSRAIMAAVISFGAVTASWADPSDTLNAWMETNVGAKQYTPDEVMQMEPPGPNPWLSFLPSGSETDWAYWSARRSAEASIRAAKAPRAHVRVKAKKKKADLTKRFGTNPTQVDEIDVEMEAAALPPPVMITSNPEDEGSIQLATPTDLTSGHAIRASGAIGDGPFGMAGTGSGDLDFFMIPNVLAGQEILVDVDIPSTSPDFDSFIVLYDENGDIVAFNDNANNTTSESFLVAVAPADGDYYLSIAAYFTFTLEDRFDSSTGLGAFSEGDYEVTIALDYFDDRLLTFKLRRGDIFGASITGLPGELSLKDRTGLERQGSSQDLTFVHPTASPLPSGLAAVSHAVDRTGRFSLRVIPDGVGPYTVSLKVFRSPLRAGLKRDVQTIFIDFDGATIDAQSIFGAGNNPAVLSPLSAFLSGWRLTPADENDLIDAILAVLEESLIDDIMKRGREPSFDIQILNSRDHADPFEMPNVSRVIVGGTIAELGIPTIGLAESIDVGNFETEETSVVLLDLLSVPFAVPNSLNAFRFRLAPGTSIIELVGTGVGNITAHEAGHILGNWHTEKFTALNIMDRGGYLGNTIGLGADGIFGTVDDVDVDFGRDVFVRAEGFTGVEDTLNSIAIGNPTPAASRQPARQPAH